MAPADSARENSSVVTIIVSTSAGIFHLHLHLPDSFSKTILSYQDCNAPTTSTHWMFAQRWQGFLGCLNPPRIPPHDTRHSTVNTSTHQTSTLWHSLISQSHVGYRLVFKVTELYFQRYTRNYWSLDSTGYDYRNGHVTVASITFLLWSGWRMSGRYPFLTHYSAIQCVPLSCTLSHNVWRSSCPPKSHNISRTAPTSTRATVNNGREICDWQWATKCDSDTGSPPVLPWYITESIYCHITLHMCLITRICYMLSLQNQPQRIVDNLH